MNSMLALADVIISKDNTGLEEKEVTSEAIDMETTPIADVIEHNEYNIEAAPSPAGKNKSKKRTNDQSSLRTKDEQRKKKTSADNTGSIEIGIAPSSLDNSSCAICGGRENEDYILLCDGENCGNEAHMYCLSPEVIAIFDAL